MFQARICPVKLFDVCDGCLRDIDRGVGGIFGVGANGLVG